MICLPCGCDQESSSRCWFDHDLGDIAFFTKIWRASHTLASIQSCDEFLAVSATHLYFDGVICGSRPCRLCIRGQVSQARSMAKYLMVATFWRVTTARSDHCEHFLMATLQVSNRATEMRRHRLVLLVSKEYRLGQFPAK